MIFKTHIPSYPLNLFIDNFFYYEGFDPEHSIDRFLPDGNTEIIIDLTEEPKYIYDNNTLKEIQACHHVWVSGVRTEFISIPSGKESRMLVVTFKKGNAYPFYPMPVNELTDYVVDADLIFGDKIIFLREQILSSKNIDEMFRHVETFLYSAGKNSLFHTATSDCVNFALTNIINNPGILNLESMSYKIGYSHKHFISLFKKQVGVTPKNYMKILRFQKAVLEIEKDTLINWSSIAIESGYYDQAHFINDFKLFSGFTPSEYLNKKSDNLNYVPVR
ncbi:MAG: helix-turn-helix transcriptional regulator [Ignavibacteria bacterium]|nr:helix-turn-helix transcriptional regulator [Ignavibacteria bacterium]